MVDQDAGERLAEARPREVLLREPGHPEIELVDAAVGLLERGLHGGVGSDLGEAGHLRQSIGDPDGVVVGQAVIPAALDVERGQIEAALPGGAEEEIPNVVDHLRVDLLGPVAGQILEQRVDAHLRDAPRIEEHILEPHFVANGVAIVVEELDVLAQHAVAEPERRRGKLRGDAGVYVGAVPAIVLQRV